MEDLRNGFLERLGSAAYGAVEGMIDDQSAEAGEWLAEKLIELVENTDTPWDNEALEKMSYLFAAASRTIDENLGLEASV